MIYMLNILLLRLIIHVHFNKTYYEQKYVSYERPNKKINTLIACLNQNSVDVLH